MRITKVQQDGVGELSTRNRKILKEIVNPVVRKKDGVWILEVNDVTIEDLLLYRKLKRG